MTVVNGKKTVKPIKVLESITPKKPLVKRTSPAVVIPTFQTSPASLTRFSYNNVQPLPLPQLSGAEQFRANFANVQDLSSKSVVQLVPIAAKARDAIEEARKGIEGAVSNEELQYYTEAFEDEHELYEEACRHLRRQGFALPEISSDIPRNHFVSIRPTLPNSKSAQPRSSHSPRSRSTTQTKIQAIPLPVIEPVLCREQQELVDLIMLRRNVFYTGSAGCGKSTVLKNFVKALEDRGLNVDIVAPTGRAALDIHGSTTWTYAGWTPDSFKKSLKRLKADSHQKHVYKRLKATDVLVIDEISMVENLHFQRLDAVMRESRGCDRPFGGVQLVVTGDFCQLPPVKPFQFCIDCGQELKANFNKTEYTCNKHGVYEDIDKWAFRSKAWADCNLEHVHLTQIHRQSDEVFIKLLQKCRVGTPFTLAEIDLLMNHPSETENAVKLFPTREEVRVVNKQNFDKLKTEKFTYKCYDDFDWNEKHVHLKWKAARNEWNGSLNALRDHRFEPLVDIKEGMLVILLVNLDLQKGLINGSQGTVVGFEKHDAANLPKAPKKEKDSNLAPTIQGDYAQRKEEHVRRFINAAEHQQWPIVQFQNGEKRTIYADCTINELGDEKPYSLLCRTQIPLAPAWAMSIHKSQGMTLDRVIVDLTKGFEEGQMYVALSRARSLEGLKVLGLGKLANGGNPQVKQFLKEKFGIE